MEPHILEELTENLAESIKQKSEEAIKPKSVTKNRVTAISIFIYTYKINMEHGLTTGKLNAYTAYLNSIERKKFPEELTRIIQEEMKRGIESIDPRKIVNLPNSTESLRKLINSYLPNVAKLLVRYDISLPTIEQFNKVWYSVNIQKGGAGADTIEDEEEDEEEEDEDEAKSGNKFSLVSILTALGAATFFGFSSTRTTPNSPALRGSSISRVRPPSVAEMTLFGARSPVLSAPYVDEFAGMSKSVTNRAPSVHSPLNMSAGPAVRGSALELSRVTPSKWRSANKAETKASNNKAPVAYSTYQNYLNNTFPKPKGPAEGPNMSWADRILEDSALTMTLGGVAQYMHNESEKQKIKNAANRKEKEERAKGGLIIVGRALSRDQQVEIMRAKKAAYEAAIKRGEGEEAAIAARNAAAIAVPRAEAAIAAPRAEAVETRNAAAIAAPRAEAVETRNAAAIEEPTPVIAAERREKTLEELVNENWNFGGGYVRKSRKYIKKSKLKSRKNQKRVSIRNTI
jgi:hypothetical protein